MSNPLLSSFFLPPFTSILPEHVVPAIQDALTRCYNTVEKVLTYPGSFTWENLCQPLADANDHLNRIWSPVSHLNAVKNSNELRTVYEQSLILLSEYSTWVGQHKGLYQAYLSLRRKEYYRQLSAAARKMIDNTIRDFELAGIRLPLEQQKRYGFIVSRLSTLGSVYSNNVLDSIAGWSRLVTNLQELSGIPEWALLVARNKAQHRKQDGWLLTLDFPSYLSVITYCDTAELRKDIYQAYNTIASDKSPNACMWDNSVIMDEIIALRYELAQLLGFNSYADYSIATKMAKNSKEVLDFLFDLAARLRNQGEQEFKQLCAFAKCSFACSKIEPWDLAYYREKQKQHLFSINDEELRPYFPVTRVLNGLFEILKRIYGVFAKERTDIDTWHPDVRFFEIFDDQNELRGSFYLDLYSRDDKYGGAWMDDCVSMMRKSDGFLQKPVAYITCNFNSKLSDIPSLLTHNEVITLFHEFGHGLQHMLTCIYTPGVSGINGVPWDAVEIPSQFMENYCWQPEALSFISGHYESGDHLPSALLNSLLESKKYQSSLLMLRQVEISLFDFCLHHQYNPDEGTCILDVFAKIKKQVGVLPVSPWCRFPHSFTHIFSGSYAAGYYSYLWAEVLAADIWSRFEEEGIFNRDTGQSFLDTILTSGGSEDPMILFTRFRGRAPKLDAMLRNHGINNR